MKTRILTESLARRSICLSRTLAALLCLGSLLCVAPVSAPAQTTTEKVSAAADSAKQKVADASQATATKLDQLWRAIDESRLKNRTPDQIAAWIIMGLLVGSILSKATRSNWIAAVAFGLIGAFVGGIIAKVSGIDLGMGPVLIRYEELLFAFLGGAALLLAVHLLGRSKVPKK